MKLTLIRGLPGSGKSTMARNLDAVHLEADMYFTDCEGTYNFDPALIKDAHQWCQSEAECHLSEGTDVVVSNTFIKRWEMESYFKLAKKYSASLEVIVANGNYDNVHDLPVEVLHRMRDNWED